MTEVARVSTDADRLGSQERRIATAGAKAVRAVVEIGGALHIIRDERLYLTAGFRTFDSYCMSRWDMRREAVDRMIRSAEVANILMGADRKLPRSEYALRVIAPYTKDPAELLTYWTQAEITAGDGPVTGAILERVIMGTVVDVTPIAPIEPVAPVAPVEPHFVPHSEVSLDSLSGELEMSDEVLKYVLEPQPQIFQVYRIFDTDGKIIYVGRTSRGLQRTWEHSRNSAWFPHACRSEWESYIDPRAAEIREADLIRKFSPPFNVQYNPDWHAARTAYEEELPPAF